MTRRRPPSTAAPEVSIVVVTHNAFIYCLRLFSSLPRTRDVRYEIVVVDNRSRPPTRLLLTALAHVGRIQRLCLLNRNTLFAQGNNVGVDASSRDAPLVLLLNSDIEVRDRRWLRRLIDAHQRGITALGYVDQEPISRADGYCLLIDRDLYRRHRLDEAHQWWWCVTKLQAAVLREGLPVRAVRDHRGVIAHFGRKAKSQAPPGATGMDVSEEQVLEWFAGRRVEAVASIDAL